MTDRGPTPEDLARQAGELAAAGAWEALRRLLDEVERDSVAATPALAYRYGEALYHTGDMRELEDFAARYEAAARESADLVETMRALNLGGIAAFELGDVDRARLRWEELMGLADVGDHADMMARAANNLGAVANLRGDGRGALAFYRLAIPSYQRIGQARGLAQTYHNLGVTHRDLEEHDESVAAFSRAQEIADEIDYPTLTLMTLVSRGELEANRGDATLAAGLADRAVGLARELSDPINEGGALRVRGLGRLGLGLWTVARDDFEAALGIARRTENALLEAETLRDLGRAELSRGEASGRERIEAAARAFSTLGASAEADRLRAELEGESG